MDDQNKNDTADDDVGVTEAGEVAVEAGESTEPADRAVPPGTGSGRGPEGQGRGVTGAGDERRAASLRRQAGAALAVLGAVLVGVVAFTTPWRALPAAAPAVTPDPARDFTAAQVARSQAFDAATSLPSYLSLGIGLVFAGLLVATPLGAKLLGWVRGPWWVRVLLGVFAITAIEEALRWPLGIWFETVLRDYGLSTQDWVGWTGDRLKGIGINAALLAVMVLAIVALARGSAAGGFPPRWARSR